MALLTVQVNHPGRQKEYKVFGTDATVSEGYRILSNKQVIREWNNDILPKNKRPHYRKFIKNKGEYIYDLDLKPKKCNLLFWGEWEGNSFFRLIGNGKGTPNGIHEPFQSIVIHGHQNTDPYVFGEYFKYAVCSQTGIMKTLDNGSLILFGTTIKQGFLLDTVFVVKCNEPADIIRNTNGAKYSQVYKEETLNQLCEYLKVPFCYNIEIKLYRGQTYWECNNYFSFVPCRKVESGPFDKILLDNKSFPWLSKCRQGHPFRHLIGRKPIDIWNEIANFLLKQKFYLGIRFSEPVSYSHLLLGPSTNIQTEPKLKKSC